MVSTPAKDQRRAYTFTGNEPIRRLVTELAFHHRQLNLSEIVRLALIEKADRDLPANWREQVGFEDSAA